MSSIWANIWRGGGERKGRKYSIILSIKQSHSLHTWQFKKKIRCYLRRYFLDLVKFKDSSGPVLANTDYSHEKFEHKLTQILGIPFRLVLWKFIFVTKEGQFSLEHDNSPSDFFFNLFNDEEHLARFSSLKIK